MLSSELVRPHGAAHRAHELDRVRALASFTVVLLHAAWTPASPVYRDLGLAARQFSSLLLLATSCCVPAFLFVTFLLLERRLSSEVSYGEVLRRRFDRLVPAYLFWSALYLAPKLAIGLVERSDRVVLDAFLLGTAAAHLYFIPLLLALTALWPLLRWIAHRPWLAAAVVVAAPMLSAHAWNAWHPTSPWVQSLLGISGNACYAIAGLAVGHVWRGTQPPAAARRAVALASVVVVAVAVRVMVRIATAESLTGVAVAPTPLEHLVLVAYAIAMPCLLIATARVPSPWARALAPLTFGIYLSHSVFVKGLQSLEAHLPFLAGHEGALMLPNGLCALAAAVALTRWGRSRPVARRLFA